MRAARAEAEAERERAARAQQAADAAMRTALSASDDVESLLSQEEARHKQQSSGLADEIEELRGQLEREQSHTQRLEEARVVLEEQLLVGAASWRALVGELKVGDAEIARLVEAAESAGIERDELRLQHGQLETRLREALAEPTAPGTRRRRRCSRDAASEASKAAGQANARTVRYWRRRRRCATSSSSRRPSCRRRPRASGLREQASLQQIAEKEVDARGPAVHLIELPSPEAAARDAESASRASRPRSSSSRAPRRLAGHRRRAREQCCGCAATIGEWKAKYSRGDWEAPPARRPARSLGGGGGAAGNGGGGGGGAA